MASERPDTARIIYSPADLGYLRFPLEADGGYGRPMVIRDADQLKRATTDGESRPRPGGVEAQAVCQAEAQAEAEGEGPMSERRIDVPREELIASWVFLKAKVRAGIRGMEMRVRKLDNAFMAVFTAPVGGERCSFAITVGFDQLKQARCVTDYLASQMARQWMEFLSRVDSYFITQWMMAK